MQIKLFSFKPLNKAFHNLKASQSLKTVQNPKIILFKSYIGSVKKLSLKPVCVNPVM